MNEFGVRSTTLMLTLVFFGLVSVYTLSSSAEESLNQIKKEEKAVSASTLCPVNQMPIPSFRGLSPSEIVPSAVPSGALKTTLKESLAGGIKTAKPAPHSTAPAPTSVSALFHQTIVAGSDTLISSDTENEATEEEVFVQEVTDNTLAPPEDSVITGLFVMARKDAPAGQGFFEIILPKNISQDAATLRNISKTIEKKMEEADKAMVNLAAKYNISVYDVRNLEMESFALNAHANAALRERLAHMGNSGHTFERIRRNAYWQVSQTTLDRFTEFSSDEESSEKVEQPGALKLNCTQLDAIQKDIAQIKEELTLVTLRIIRAYQPR